MIDSAGLANTDALYSSQVTIIETFQLGVNPGVCQSIHESVSLCKVIVIVSVAAIIFLLLQKTGLIPTFGGGGGGGY